MVIGPEVIIVIVGLMSFAFALGAITVVLVYEHIERKAKANAEKIIELADVPTVPVMRVQLTKLPRRSYMRTDYRLPCTPKSVDGGHADTGSGE